MGASSSGKFPNSILPILTNTSKFGCKINQIKSLNRVEV
tara:strand:- start:123 stop:239 length:117 start_codon:yes stop_codon:yes gene_type:complete